MYIYSEVLYSLKKEGTSAICYNVDEFEDIFLSGISQKDKFHMIPLPSYLE